MSSQLTGRAYALPDLYMPCSYDMCDVTIFLTRNIYIRTLRQARTTLTKQDVRGMTYVMYAINPEAMNIRLSIDGSNLLAIREGLPLELGYQSSTSPNRPTQTGSPLTVSRTSGGDEILCAAHSVDQNVGHDTYAPNPWVPVVKRVLEYARQCLWMPEVCPATRFIRL